MLTLIPFVSPATILVAGSRCVKLIAVFGTLLAVVNSVMGVMSRTRLIYNPFIFFLILVNNFCSVVIYQKISSTILVGSMV